MGLYLYCTFDGFQECMVEFTLTRGSERTWHASHCPCSYLREEGVLMPLRPIQHQPPEIPPQPLGFCLDLSSLDPARLAIPFFPSIDFQRQKHHLAIENINITIKIIKP